MYFDVNLKVWCSVKHQHTLVVYIFHVCIRVENSSSRFHSQIFVHHNFMLVFMLWTRLIKGHVTFSYRFHFLGHVTIQKWNLKSGWYWLSKSHLGEENGAIIISAGALKNQFPLEYICCILIFLACHNRKFVCNKHALKLENHR
jgi:hypothetical protein